MNSDQTLIIITIAYMGAWAIALVVMLFVAVRAMRNQQ